MTYPFDNQVMLDLETVGKRAGCGILSIGACTLGNEPRENFYVTIDIESCYDYALQSDSSTIEWWARQDAAVRAEAFSGKTSLPDALTAFAIWYRQVQANALWGNGADFDKPILEAAYAACGIEVPWKYNAGRCYRTLRALYPQVPAAPFSGARHNALADAVNQAAHCHAILRHIYGGS